MIFTEQIILLVVMLVAFYFFLILPQRKRDKKHKELIASLDKGSDIITIGGIEGKVVAIKDESISVETGSGTERSRIVIKKWAIKEVIQKEQA